MYIYIYMYSRDKYIVLISKIDCTIVCNYKFRWINNPNQFFHTQKVYVNFCLIITYRHCIVFKFPCDVLINHAGLHFY